VRPVAPLRPVHKYHNDTREQKFNSVGYTSARQHIQLLSKQPYRHLSVSFSLVTAEKLLLRFFNFYTVYRSSIGHAVDMGCVAYIHIANRLLDFGSIERLD